MAPFLLRLLFYSCLLQHTNNKTPEQLDSLVISLCPLENTFRSLQSEQLIQFKPGVFMIIFADIGKYYYFYG